MATITLSITDDIKRMMDSFPEINWSGFVRSRIEEKVRSLSWKEEMLKRLEGEKEFDEWAVQLSRKARKGHFAQLKKQGLV